MSGWGLFVIAALDGSIIFFLPLAVDIGVVILASRSHEFFWVYPIIAAVGFVCGAAVTFYIGRHLGEAGLTHFVSKQRLAGFQRRIEGKGAVALALLSLIPPPFPFTACILAAGALRVNPWLFLTTLGAARLLKYEAEAALAFFYGRQIIRWLESDTLAYVGAILFALAVLGTAFSASRLWLKTRASRASTCRERAA